MDDYYRSLAGLRERLEHLGAGAEADALLRAERSATTSGEAISNIGTVLRQALDSGLGDRLGVRAELESILRVGEDAWNKSNRA